jgi:micrococcal nuclease
MRRLVAAVLVLLAGCTGGVGPWVDGPSFDPVEGAEVTVEVTQVVDGDTVKIRYENGTADTVRLVGVDTPEVHVENDPTKFEGVPDTEAGRACLDRHGERASSYAKERMAHRTVGLAFDPDLETRGYYDRLLAYVVIDGTTVNYDLVAEGYARVYDSEFSRRGEFRTAERAALENATGVWRCATDDPGTDTPTATPAGDGVVIAEINADAEGNDNRNLNDEYVVLRNRGDEAVSLDGWTVADEAGATYEFGGVGLDSGDRITLHTGSGERDARHVYWDRNGAVWNNDGDTVTVRDANGTVVARRSY